MQPPSLWGVEKIVAERLGAGPGKIAHLETTKQELHFDYPFSPAEAVAFFRKYFGPTQTTFARLDEPAQKALAEDLTQHWAKKNIGDANHTVIKAEYLEVHATLA
jgi:hypothetical protein